MNLRNLAGSFSFAHLAGLSPKGKKAEDDDAHTDAAAAEDGDEEEMAAAEADPEDDKSDDGEKGKKGKKSKKAKKAKKKEGETDSHDDNQDSDEDDDGEEDTDDDTGDEDAKTKKAIAKGRRLERKRIGAILNAPASADNMQLACDLACNTDLAPAAAVAIVKSAGPRAPARRAGLSDRMSQSESPRIGAAPAAPGKEAAISTSWDNAMKEFMPPAR
jgi:hypothetical protein